MADLWVVLAVLAFFGVCVALVCGCDLIIGPDDESELDDTGNVRRRGRDRQRCSPMTGENIAGLVLAVLLMLYLVAALVVPERF